jgi:ParB-like chromosome segregation protein Spo0J
MTTDPSHIGDLTPDPQNRRKRTSRGLGLLVDSLQKVGAARSIVIDEDNIIRAGSGTIEAAAEAGITKLVVVDADGETIVAVRRTGLTEAQKRDLSLYDNRTSELAEWDIELLQHDVTAGKDLAAFFTPKELKRLLKTPVQLTMPEVKLEKTTTCPHCGHTFSPT